MKIDRLLHVNIRCSPADLPRLEKFYENALGMKSGYRPDFGRAGAWLYYEDEPLIHINALFPDGSIEKTRFHNGSVDHIAFKCTGSAELRARLVQNGIDFHEENVENAGYQIFMTDPVGTRLEFNFPSREAPDTIAFRVQTRADRKLV